MKSLILILSLISAQVGAATPPAQREVMLALSDASTPSRHTVDGRFTVFVSGRFPNSCYHWERSSLSSPTPLLHEIRAYAMVDQTMCLMVVLPFKEEIDLGNLSSGEHIFRFFSGDGTYFERTMTVE